MRKRLAIVMAGSSIALCGDVAFAPSLSFAQSMTPMSRQAYCTRQANRWKHFNASVFEHCMHPQGSGANRPPARPPSVSPPQQPSVGGDQPLTPRARECNRAVADAGLVGTAAQRYLQNCVGAH